MHLSLSLYIYIYIYIYPACSKPTANLRAKILDFKGFDSSIILISKGGIFMSKGEFPRNSESTNLIRDDLSRKIGRNKIGTPDPN